MSAVQALRKFRRTGKKEHLEVYLTYRFSYKKQQKNAKLQKKTENEKNITTHFRAKKWSKLWELIKPNKKKSVDSVKISTDEWLSHFDKQFNIKTTKKWTTCTSELPEVETLDCKIKDKEVLECLKSLKEKKAGGIDGINNKIIKKFKFFLLDSLTRLFNFILDSGSYPGAWARAIIHPIYKKRGSIHKAENYRGIGLLTSFGKIFNKILQKRLYRLFNKKPAFCSRVHNFCPISIRFDILDA